ncbi:MAG TPA: hypothetical protein VMW30_02280 [Candidatus Paceibacterota bacterium]|nr:hypothetical protein [Candidatus Paceibacterota bacterium]
MSARNQAGQVAAIILKMRCGAYQSRIVATVNSVIRTIEENTHP